MMCHNIKACLPPKTLTTLRIFWFALHEQHDSRLVDELLQPFIKVPVSCGGCRLSFFCRNGGSSSVVCKLDGWIDDRNR